MPRSLSLPWRGFARQSTHRITGRCCILPPLRGPRPSSASQSPWPLAHRAQGEGLIMASDQPGDRWRIGAIFLIVPGSGAGVEIVVAPGLLLACGADAYQVALQEGLRARQGRLVDAEGFQKPWQFVACVRAVADQRSELGGGD